MENKSIYNQLKVTSYKLREMRIGQSSVFTETKGEASGRIARSLANKSGIKVKSKICYITDLSSPDTESPILIKAVIVTRLT